ncbi:serine/threonine-protein kinase [Streptomyces sp. NBC_00233]|uniref:serine/threonine-protein kinase n=1 Tax=Streptomyces sp. NBC_00233 TaxID=2975686 RepID=UPI00224F01AF|nr:serine/threonine-protein kinase [Streptomyces sp. NBC_00233]MCX5232118.1 serine/threonine protein kinase [Streptomyces sp. NBC_00233]
MNRVIDGRFELVERLGGGGMGTVWRARDLVLHRDVAVKEVRPPDPALAEHDVEGARTLRERVLREARALARIDHPNVVTIHHIVDAGEGTYPWLVMELVTGGSLQDRLDRGSMTPVEAATLGRELLSALRAAHERDIEHRDVKPANVLLRPDGRPVLTDFGIAAIRESTVLTASGSIIGSPDYMAPERIRGGGGSGPAADLWSLGMVLYVAVEGHHPLRRENTLATLAAVLSDDVPPPQRAGELTGLLNGLLVREPSARPDAAELDRALAAVTSPDASARPGLRQDADAVRGPAAAPANGAGPKTFGEPGAAGTGAVTSFHLAPPASHLAPPATSGAGSAAATTAPQGGGSPTDAPPSAASPAAAAVFAPSGAFSSTAPSSSPAGGAGRRRSRTARFLGSAAVVVLAVGIPVAAMSWDWRPGDPGSGPSSAPPSQQGPVAQRPDASGTPTSSSTPSPAPSKGVAPVKGSLLTPAGVRSAIAAIKEAAGGTMVTSFVVYPDYAISESLVKGSTKRYDRYMYRGEDAAVRQGSGTAFPGALPTDLDDFDWDALPALMKRADRELGVDEPTSRYLVITPASSIFGTKAGMSVYLSDTYGSAYLQADAKGRVTATYPREN